MELIFIFSAIIAFILGFIIGKLIIRRTLKKYK
jgi:uncharacterized membrane-anchored protein YhcB (DUF1043 family)